MNENIIVPAALRAQRGNQRGSVKMIGSPVQRQIQDTDIINNGTASEYLEGIVTEMGVSTQKAKLFMKNFENIVNTADSQRKSVSGVDEDEETMNLQKYREAYNLCSHVISVMSQCYNKLINETGI